MSAVHPLIASYLNRHDLNNDSVQSNGRATFMVDDVYRIHIEPAKRGWLVITARIGSIPKAGFTRDNFLLSVGKIGFGMLSRFSSTCVIDSHEEALWLQQSLRPDSKEILVDEEIGKFVNALSFWVRVVKSGL